MTRAIVIALLLVACATSRPIGPTVIVRFVSAEEWDESDRAHIDDGIEAWRELGFDPILEVDTDQQPCPNRWMFSGVVDCKLVIGVRREVGMMTRFESRGQADRVTDTVRVDASIKGPELAHVVAHEVGHIILNTAKHVHSYGVMLSGGMMRRLSAQDRALACETIGRGCK